MPLVNEQTAMAEWTEPDDVPRPFVAYASEVIGRGVFELPAHRHRKCQIVMVRRGAIACEVEGGLWIVPSRSALWIPSHALHGITVTGPLDGYGAFMDSAVATRLPDRCCAVSVTPLLRELLARAATLPLDYEENEETARLLAVLVDELARAPVEDLHLPMPTDPRLRAIVDRMIATPADQGTVKDWAARSGVSERTLVRLIARETGLSFGRWRRQLSAMLAVKWLAGGATIQSVAADLGYESVPSFTTMFRKTLGTSPGRYMAERHLGRH